MNKTIRKQCAGYEYTYEDEAWSITTDYINENIYINAPEDDNGVDAIKHFGIAIGKAVADMKKDLK